MTELQNERSRKMKKLWNLVKREEGTEIAEWAVLFAAVLLAAIAVMLVVGPKVEAVWNQISTALD
jgi:Flp pilus assembly pilin Flp